MDWKKQLKETVFLAIYKEYEQWKVYWIISKKWSGGKNISKVILWDLREMNE